MKIMNKKAALFAVAALMSVSLQASNSGEMHALPYNGNNEMHILPHHENNEVRTQPYNGNNEMHTLPYNENNEVHTLPYDEQNEVRIQPYEGETGAIALPYNKNEVKTLPHHHVPSGYQAPTGGTRAGVGYKAGTKRALPITK